MADSIPSMKLIAWYPVGAIRSHRQAIRNFLIRDTIELLPCTIGIKIAHHVYMGYPFAKECSVRPMPPPTRRATEAERRLPTVD
jgi:hypothetical protein